MAKKPPQKRLKNAKSVTGATSLTKMRMAYNESVQGGSSPGRGPRKDNTRSVPQRGVKLNRHV
jgi:hypothetical protein